MRDPLQLSIRSAGQMKRNLNDKFHTYAISQFHILQNKSFVNFHSFAWTYKKAVPFK
jgi:hypothetical protein